MCVLYNHLTTLYITTTILLHSTDKQRKITYNYTRTTPIYSYTRTTPIYSYTRTTLIYRIDRGRSPTATPGLHYSYTRTTLLLHQDYNTATPGLH